MQWDGMKGVVAMGWFDITKDLRSNPKPRVSSDRTGPGRNRSGNRDTFLRIFSGRVGSEINISVSSGSGNFYRGIIYFYMYVGDVKV